MVCSNAGAMAAERAQVHREYMLRRQEALQNRARGHGGVLSPYVSQMIKKPNRFCYKCIKNNHCLQCCSIKTCMQYVKEQRQHYFISLFDCVQASPRPQSAAPGGDRPVSAVNKPDDRKKAVDDVR